ncbi:hypothetical protein ACOMHN_058701 [Nucella lapillus]
MSVPHLHKRRQHDSSTPSLPRTLRVLRTEGTSLQKLLKEELRMTIMSKRHAKGQADLQMDFPEPTTRELTMAELERRERRREQNRRAAQRCRRKKRMNQMSVIQNYEWIVTRNQQLEQELDRLRQEKNQVQSLLKAHYQACTCTQAQTLLPHLLDPPAIKAEPGDESLSSAQAGFGPHDVSHAASESWQYDSADGMTPACSAACIGQHADGMTPACSAACIGQQAYGSQNGHLQSGCFPSLSPFTSTTASGHSHSDHASSSATSCLNGARESSAPTPGAGTVGAPVYSNGRSLTTLVPALPYSSPHCAQPVPQAPVTSSAFSLLDELACVPGGLRACVFQDEAATPLSADGRRSLSSVSSDVSAMSEQPVGDVTGVSADLPGADLYITDDMSTNDVSQLLSQINQSDLIFQPDGGNLDEVFSDTVVSSLNALPEHFLQSL